MAAGGGGVRLRGASTFALAASATTHRCRWACHEVGHADANANALVQHTLCNFIKLPRRLAQSTSQVESGTSTCSGTSPVPVVLLVPIAGLAWPGGTV